MTLAAHILISPLHIAALGHLIRDIACAKKPQRREHRVAIASSKPGARIVRRFGVPWAFVRELPPLSSSLFTRESAGRVEEPRGVDRAYVDACIHDELALIRRRRPDVVLVDFRHTAGVSAALAGVRSISLYNLHQLGSLLVQEQQQETMRQTGLSESVVQKVFGDAIAIVGYPWFEPLQVAPAEGLTRALRSVDEIRFVGPLLINAPADLPARAELRHRYARPGRKLVLVTFGGAARVLAALQATLAGLRDVDADFVIVTGTSIHPDAVREAVHEIGRANRGAAISLVGYEPRLMEVMKAADCAVTHAGHTTLMEAVACGTPIVSIGARPGYEGVQNAAPIERLGIGRALGGGPPGNEADMCAEIEARVASTVIEVLSDERFAERSRSLARVARRLRGPTEFARFVEWRLAQAVHL